METPYRRKRHVALGSTAPTLLVALALGLSPVLSAEAPGEDRDLASYVDPFIGTDAHGHTYPGATLPFGMVQLSPDTRLEGWDGCSGYHFTDEIVYGFSHTHLSGTGVSDYGDVLLMPMIGTPMLDNGAEKGPDHGYASRFSKSTERAEPGYYAVRLDDPGIEVELTTTARTGFHRYRLPPEPSTHVIVDLRHRDRLLGASMRVVSDRQIEGYRRSTAWAKDQVVHFVARFSKPFDTAGFLGSDGQRHGSLDGEAAVGALSFGDAGNELLVQVGISAVDIDGARANLEQELGPGGLDRSWDFDAVRARARNTWNDSLTKIEVEGGTEDQRTIFYTGLYHSLIVPNLYSDVDGRYLGMDGQIHRTTERRHYTVFSLWDTFRATHPLYNLIERQRSQEFVRTFLAMYEQGGRLPVWELAANETDTMIGYHAASVIAEAWSKGIRGFDAELALDAMIDSAEREHFGLEAYQRQGFIGSEDEGESVSKTLEYAYDDFCIARLAHALGKNDTEERYLERSQGWLHLLDPDTGFMRPRRNQRFSEPFDPRRVDNNYTEANSWQYSFFVPHDIRGLVAALGGDRAFEERLDALFAADPATTGRHQVDITGLIGQYAHGNEPSHHMAFLYHHVGRPDRSADRVRTIVETLYSTAADGLSGNEDCGQMSSWYVFAAMGLYPVNPCAPDYVIVPPIFDSVTLRLDGQDGAPSDRRFTLRTEGEGPYIVSAALVGPNRESMPLEHSHLRHEEILAGGELVLRLGKVPGTWGHPEEHRPRSPVDFSKPEMRMLAAPHAVAEQDVFRGSQTVDLRTTEPGAVVRRSLDGAPFELHDGPLQLAASTRIRFHAEKEGRRSPIVEAYFHRIPHDWQIELGHEPNPSYTAGGAMALIDGLRGTANWRTGGWQGYQYSDFEAKVDLLASRPIRRVGANFLQDIKSWIWMPAEVVVSVADVAEGPYREIARIGHAISDGADGQTWDEVILRELVAEDLDAEGRFVRIHARNYGPIPKWHPGFGDRAFIFVDELIIE